MLPPVIHYKCSHTIPARLVDLSEEEEKGFDKEKSTIYKSASSLKCPQCRLLQPGQSDKVTEEQPSKITVQEGVQKALKKMSETIEPVHKLLREKAPLDKLHEVKGKLRHKFAHLDFLKYYHKIRNAAKVVGGTDDEGLLVLESSDTEELTALELLTGNAVEISAPRLPLSKLKRHSWNAAPSLCFRGSSSHAMEQRYVMPEIFVSREWGTFSEESDSEERTVRSRGPSLTTAGGNSRIRSASATVVPEFLRSPKAKSPARSPSKRVSFVSTVSFI